MGENLEASLPYSADWKTQLEKSFGNVFEDYDRLFWDDFQPELIMDPQVSDIQLFRALIMHPADDLQELNDTVFWTLATTPLVGLIYNTQTLFTKEIPTWIFATASLGAACIRIQSLVAENRELLTRHYVVSSMISRFDLLPGFVEYSEGSRNDREAVFSGKIVQGYYKARVPQDISELIG